MYSDVCSRVLRPTSMPLLFNTIVTQFVISRSLFRVLYMLFSGPDYYAAIFDFRQQIVLLFLHEIFFPNFSTYVILFGPTTTYSILLKKSVVAQTLCYGSWGWCRIIPSVGGENEVMPMPTSSALTVQQIFQNQMKVTATIQIHFSSVEMKLECDQA